MYRTGCHGMRRDILIGRIRDGDGPKGTRGRHRYEFTPEPSRIAVCAVNGGGGAYCDTLCGHFDKSGYDLPRKLYRGDERAIPPVLDRQCSQQCVRSVKPHSHRSRIERHAASPVANDDPAVFNPDCGATVGHQLKQIPEQAEEGEKGCHAQQRENVPRVVLSERTRESVQKQENKAAVDSN